MIETSDAVHFVHFKRNGWLQPAVPADVAKFWPEEYKDPDGQFAAYRAHLSVIAYNTKLVKPEDAPKSHADLLRPEVEGQAGEGASGLQRHHHDRHPGAERRRWAGTISRSWASRR